MIYSVTVTNHLGRSLKMVLGEPWESGLLIESIEGLGPTDADINSVEYATGDGSVFNSARQHKRTITMKIDPLEKPDVETTRHLCYEMFPVKREVTLLFETDYRLCSCTGHVETCKPDIFSDKEQMDISIVCDDPFFYSVNNLYVLNGLDNLFEFPFSNESLTEDLIDFGELRYDVGAPIEYNGDAESGCIITFNCTGEVKNPKIRNLETGEVMNIDTTKFSYIVGDNSDRLKSNDTFVINTMYGKKSAKLYRNGVEYNCIACLDRDTDWLQLHHGTNTFGYNADLGLYNCTIDIQSFIVYSGV